MSFSLAGMYGPEAVLSTTGTPAPSTPVTVYLHSTVTVATLYTDQTKGSTTTNPVSTDTRGNLVFFAVPGYYDLSFTIGGVPTTVPVEVLPWYSDVDWTPDIGLPVAATGLTGATAATRFVGGTTFSAPASGTFALGDFVIDQTGAVWVCITAGSPGTWANASCVQATQATLGSNTIGTGSAVRFALTGTYNLNSQIAYVGGNQFKCLVAGYYDLYMSLMASGSTSSALQSQIRVNGTVQAYSWDAVAASALYATSKCRKVVFCNVNDTIDFWAIASFASMTAVVDGAVSIAEMRRVA